MKILHLALSHYWVLPFALALLLPRRRTVAGAVAALAPVLVCFNLGSEARLATACIMTLGMALGIALGRLMRAMLGGMSAKARSRAVIAVAGLGCLLMLPGSMATSVAAVAHQATLRIQNWEARMPSDACMAARHPVSVGGATYYVPAAPVITVRTAGPAYHFQYGRSLRTLCRTRGGVKAPLHATGLNFDFSIPVQGAFCHAAKGRWERGLCDAAAPDAWPAMVNIYAPEEYDRQHLMPAPTYASFVADQNKAVAAGHPFQPQSGGIMDRYGNGYWVARNGAWKDEAGEPYTLHCQDTDTPEVLSCETSYRLRSGPQLTYRFTAPARMLPQAAQSMERHVHAMLDAFSTPGAASAPQAARR